MKKEGRTRKLFLFFGFFVFLLFGAREANAATLYFSPSSGNFSVGNILTVNILVNTENAYINNAEATVNFPSSLLEIISISKSGSVFTLWVEDPTFSNNAGTLSFNGGLPTPGFNGANGKILSAVFRVKRAGSATVAFSSPAVRANDGYGTNVFRVGAQAQFNLISVEETTPLPLPSSSPVIGTSRAPVISSPTHLDPNKWYANNNPIFRWDVPTGVTEVLLVLNRSAGAVPSVRYTSPISERVLEDLEEGTWYLNARFRTVTGLGPVTSFRFNIDTVAPRPFNVVRLDNDDLTNPRPELLFESSDATSGIEKYQVKIGDGEWFDIEPSLVGRPYAIPLQRYGNYLVQVRALDRASNSTSAELDIKINPIKSPVILEATREVKRGESIKVEGNVEPGMKVLVEFVPIGSRNFFSIIPEVYAQENKSNSLIYEATVDENGNWSLEVRDLSPGRYNIYAVAQDERGAISEPSNSKEVYVRGGIFEFLFRIFDWFIDTISNRGLFIAFLIALIGLILVIVELIRIKGRRWIKKGGLKPFIDLMVIKRTQQKSNDHIEHIIEDMEKELTFLRTLSKRRKLGPEETYLRDKIVQYLKTLKGLKNLDE